MFVLLYMKFNIVPVLFCYLLIHVQTSFLLCFACIEKRYLYTQYVYLHNIVHLKFFLSKRVSQQYFEHLLWELKYLSNILTIRVK